MTKKLNLPKPSKPSFVAPDEKFGIFHWMFIGFMLGLLVMVILR